MGAVPALESRVVQDTLVSLVTSLPRRHTLVDVNAGGTLAPHFRRTVALEQDCHKLRKACPDAWIVPDTPATARLDAQADLVLCTDVPDADTARRMLRWLTDTGELVVQSTGADLAELARDLRDDHDVTLHDGLLRVR